MNIPSSGALSSLAAAISSSSAGPANVRAINSNDGTDLVRLTEPEQVYVLYSQGRTVPQIASSLNLTAQAVDAYLNISSVKS